MNAIEIIDFFADCGANFKEEDLSGVHDYLTKMLDDHRVLAIFDGHEVIAIVTFSICSDYKKYYSKGVWEYMEHDPYGCTLYIEKLVSKTWNLELRRLMQDLFLEKYPFLTRGIWHRSRDNEDCLIQAKRRFDYV